MVGVKVLDLEFRRGLVFDGSRDIFFRGVYRRVENMGVVVGFFEGEMGLFLFGCLFF